MMPFRTRSAALAMRVDFLKHPTLMAPMEGVGHFSFREMVAERGGVGMLCTEFVRVHKQALKAKYFERNVIKYQDIPLSVQVMGNDEEAMARAAIYVQAAGADVVDINLGCPSSHATKAGVGAAMLKDLDLLAKVLKAMRERLHIKLSAKIRAGFENERSLDIARVVEDCGCDFIAVHPRKRSDHYRGVADWRIIRDIKKTVSIPVVGNGDCWYAEDFQRMRDETGCDAVMVGRPAIRNPWLLRQAQELSEGVVPFAPSGKDLVSYLEQAAEVYAPIFLKEKIVTGRLKEQLRWMARAVPDERAFLRRVLRCQSTEKVLQMSREVLLPLSSDDVDLQASPKFGLEHSGSVNIAAPEEVPSIDATGRDVAVGI